MIQALTLIVMLAQVVSAPVSGVAPADTPAPVAAVQDPGAPAAQALEDLILNPLHLLLVLTPIVLLLILRKYLPAAFTSWRAKVAVFYPLPLTMAGAFLGLTTFPQPAAKVCIGIVGWLVSATLFKVAKPFLERWLKGTFGADASLPI